MEQPPVESSASSALYTPVDDRSLSMGAANAYALLFAGIPAVLLVLLFGYAHSGAALKAGAKLFFSLPVFLPSVVAGIVVHEFIHGAAWAVAGRLPWRDIRFGFQIKTLTPYAHAKVPLEARAYRIGAVMPGFLLGLLPAAAGLLLGSGAVFLFGVLMTAAAGGDLAILWTLRGVPAGALVQDHPTRAGCHVVEPAQVV